MIHKLDAFKLVRGQAGFLANLSFPNSIFGAVIRSPVSSGFLKGINSSCHFESDGGVFVKASDIPGRNQVPFVGHDQPCLVAEEIRHKGEALALIAHASGTHLNRLMNLVKADIEEFKPIYFDQIIGKNFENIFRDQSLHLIPPIEIQRGNWEHLSNREKPFVVNNTYRTFAQEHIYLETQGVVAEYLQSGQLRIWGGFQSPYLVRLAVSEVTAFAERQIEVVTTQIGGSFGGKEEYPSLLACYAALLAIKARRTVKMIYSRNEDMAFTSKRHESMIHVHGEFDGHSLKALRVEALLDGGAYTTVTAPVANRVALHASGAYEIEKVRATVIGIKTNSVPAGAFRGFGGPQITFAIERFMDLAAARLHISPIDLRLKSIVTPQTRPLHSANPFDVNLKDMILTSMTDFAFQEREQICREYNQQSSQLKRGVGMTVYLHGAGMNLDVEALVNSSIRIDYNPTRDKICLVCSVADMGQGNLTALTEILAKNLGLDIDQIEVQSADTVHGIDSGPTVASRTMTIVGDLLDLACVEILRALSNAQLDAQFQSGDRMSILRELAKKQGGELSKRIFVKDLIRKQDQNGYRTYTAVVQLAEVEVDLITYEVRPIEIACLVDAGTVVNRKISEGQIIGSILQGLGFALYEQVDRSQGIMINNSLLRYRVPRVQDLPKIQISFQKSEGRRRGLGEAALNGVAPVLASALQNAIGLHIRTNLLSPENLLNL